MMSEMELTGGGRCVWRTAERNYVRKDLKDAVEIMVECEPELLKYYTRAQLVVRLAIFCDRLKMAGNLTQRTSDRLKPGLQT
jgi:hypothetical protein